MPASAVQHCPSDELPPVAYQLDVDAPSAWTWATPPEEWRSTSVRNPACTSLISTVENRAAAAGGAATGIFRKYEVRTVDLQRVDASCVMRVEPGDVCTAVTLFWRASYSRMSMKT